MDLEQIKQNIDTRAAAESVADLACEEAMRRGKHRGRFWRLLADALVGRLPVEKQTPPSVVPMTEKESRQFDNNIMEFGKHADKRIGDVPLSYLIWLEEQPDFRRDLNRYLLSDRMQREQD